ncbi:MAG: DUF3592 domain-containing protein [Motilibacteraceae bacterium]
MSTLQSLPLRGGVLTDGTVVAVDTRSSKVRDGSGSPRRQTTYAPVVEFVGAQGTTHQVTTGVSGGTRPEVGSTRRVSYLPSDPSRARILGDRQQAMGRGLLLVAGIALLVVAVVVAR